jgi:membrane associated rhomboid family serine protease
MTYTEKKYRPKITPGLSSHSLTLLIAICLVMFVGLAFLKAVWYFRYPREEALGYFNHDILSLFVLPAQGEQILRRPWTLVTHMFVHDNFWKIFTNMLWLWCFGFIMQHRKGIDKIVPVFIYGSWGGAIAFIGVYNFLPSLQAQLPFAGMLGASAGVMALAVSATLLTPGLRLFPMIGGGIPLWVLTAFYIISDLASISFSDSGYLAAHLAGALTGFLFIFFLRRGYDGGKWMNRFFTWVNNLFNPDKPGKGKNIKEELFYKSPQAPFTKTPNLTQQRVDEILDKINQQGYDQLTEEEKDLLKKASEKL